MTTFLNMDLINLRPLKLDDIFTGDYKEALTDLLWNQLMADKKVTTHEALEDMGYGSSVKSGKYLRRSFTPFSPPAEGREEVCSVVFIRL